MALSTPVLLSTATSASSSTTRTSGTVTPSAPDVLLVVGISCLRTAAFSYTSVSTTLPNVGSWTLYPSGTHDAGANATNTLLAVARVTGTPGSGTITVTTNLSTSASVMFVAEIAGQDTTTPIALSGTGSNTTGLSPSLGATQAADAIAIAMLGISQVTAVAPTSDWVELDEQSPTAALRGQLQYSEQSVSSAGWTPTGTPTAITSVVLSVAAAAAAPSFEIAAVEVEVIASAGTVHTATAALSGATTMAAAASLVTNSTIEVAAVEVEVIASTGTTHDATASLSGTTTLTAAATISVTVEVAAVEVDVIFTPADTLAATASLAGTPTLTAAAIIVGVHEHSAWLRPGLYTSAGVELFFSDERAWDLNDTTRATLSAGAASGSLTQIHQGTASFAGVNTMTAVARQVIAVTANIASGGTLNTAARVSHGATASLAGVPVFAAGATLLQSGGTLHTATASFASTGTLAADATIGAPTVHTATASFAGTSTLAADATLDTGGAVIHLATGSLEGTTEMVAHIISTYDVSASLIITPPNMFATLVPPPALPEAVAAYVTITYATAPVTITTARATTSILSGV